MDDRPADTAGAVAAAVALAATYDVVVDGPVVLADGANVVVHLRPAPLVAKVAASTHLVREPRGSLERELLLAGHVRRSGLPVVLPSPLVPAVVHQTQGRLLTCWEHLPHDPAATVEADALGPMLRELHAALLSAPALPRLSTPLQDVRQFLTDRGDDGMRGAFDDLVLPDDDGQALHGDPHPGNLLLGPDGWTWSDLEDACSGPVAWDLACVEASTRLDGPAAVRAYGFDGDLTPWRVLRRLHATAWVCLYAERLPGHRARAAAMLASWG